MAAAVFAKGFDWITDKLLFSSSDDFKYTMQGLNMSQDVQTRFFNLLSAKNDFYTSVTDIIEVNHRISGIYGKYLTDKNGNTAANYKKHYKDYANKHYGIDFGKPNDAAPPLKGEIRAGISGIVLENFFNDNTGNAVRIAYGYKFEEAFIDTGIRGEYLHMESLSPLEIGKYVAANTIIGQVGNTGVSYGEHLHYSVYTTGKHIFSRSNMAVLFGSEYSESRISSSTDWKRVYNPASFEEEKTGHAPGWKTKS